MTKELRIPLKYSHVTFFPWCSSLPERDRDVSRRHQYFPIFQMLYYRPKATYYPS